jgi:hypothetical protein
MTATDKALRLIAEGRVRKASGFTRYRTCYSVLGDSTDAFAPEPYIVAREFVSGRIYESCNCICPTTRCSHIAAARLVDAVLGLPEPRD